MEVDQKSVVRCSFALAKAAVPFLINESLFKLLLKKMWGPPQPRVVCCVCVCVFEVFLHVRVFLACLLAGQCRSKPRVCHRQCQASQRDPATHRGLRGAADPPPALPCAPSGQRPSRAHRSRFSPRPPPKTPTTNSLAPQPAKHPPLSVAPVLPDHHRDPRERPPRFCMPIDPVGVRGGAGWLGGGVGGDN